jgi:hypothetical protein
MVGDGMSQERVLLLPTEQWEQIRAEGTMDPAFHALLIEMMTYRELEVMASVLDSFQKQVAA